MSEREETRKESQPRSEAGKDLSVTAIEHWRDINFRRKRYFALRRVGNAKVTQEHVRAQDAVLTMSGK